MALRARKWSTLDIATAELFKEAYENSEMSLRQLEARSGIKYSRLYNIFHKEYGAPLLDEFLVLCEVFSLNPAETLAHLREVADMSSSALADRDDYKLVANEDESKSIEMYDYYD